MEGVKVGKIETMSQLSEKVKTEKSETVSQLLELEKGIKLQCCSCVERGRGRDFTVLRL